MFNIIIKDNYDEVSAEAFKVMKEVIKKENCVLGLATGSSPVGLYKEMIKDYEAATLLTRIFVPGIWMNM